MSYTTGEGSALMELTLAGRRLLRELCVASWRAAVLLLRDFSDDAATQKFTPPIVGCGCSLSRPLVR